MSAAMEDAVDEASITGAEQCGPWKGCPVSSVAAFPWFSDTRTGEFYGKNDSVDEATGNVITYVGLWLGDLWLWPELAGRWPPGTADLQQVPTACHGCWRTVRGHHVSVGYFPERVAVARRDRTAEC